MSEPAWFGSLAWLQIRVRGRVRDLKAIVVKPGADPTLRVAARANAAQPTILPRSAWGADEKLRKGRPVIAPRIRAAVIHHTATPNGYAPTRWPSDDPQPSTCTRCAGTASSDLGYNYLLDAQGRIYEGRYGGIDQNVVGAHTAGFNTGTVGVALIGNFSKRDAAGEGGAGARRPAGLAARRGPRRSAGPRDADVGGQRAVREGPGGAVPGDLRPPRRRQHATARAMACSPSWARSGPPPPRSAA